MRHEPVETACLSMRSIARRKVLTPDASTLADASDASTPEQFSDLRPAAATSMAEGGLLPDAPTLARLRNALLQGLFRSS